MSLATTTTSTITTSSANANKLHHFRQPPASSRALRKSSVSASTPNLNAVYAAASYGHPRLAPPSALSRKTSLAALTPSSLASIPDVSESYALDSVLSDTSRDLMAPATPGRAAPEDVAVGDTVDVPGGMLGTVRFVGAVQGKKGVFAGVELHSEFAVKGKNNGDVDGYA